MIWAVKGEERYIPSRTAFFDPDEVHNPIGSQLSKRNAVVITYGEDREVAKRRAQPIIGGNSDRYIVEPLSADGDRVIFHLELRGEIT